MAECYPKSKMTPDAQSSPFPLSAPLKVKSPKAKEILLSFWKRTSIFVTSLGISTVGGIERGLLKTRYTVKINLSSDRFI